jgi:hypothetical protein
MNKPVTFEEACKMVGKDPNAQYHPTEKLEIITKSIVGNWNADYSNDDQEKWFPIFRFDPSVSAFRFCLSYCSYTNAYAGSGVRLVFETESQSDYAGKQFIKEYNEAML